METARCNLRYLSTVKRYLERKKKARKKNLFEHENTISSIRKKLTFDDENIAAKKYRVNCVLR